MGEHEAGRERSVGNFGNYCDGDNHKPGLELDYAYYMERYCTGTEDRSRASQELAVSGLPWEEAEKPAVAAAVDAVAAAAAAADACGDETDTDCKRCKN